MKDATRAFGPVLMWAAVGACAGEEEPSADDDTDSAGIVTLGGETDPSGITQSGGGSVDDTGGSTGTDNAPVSASAGVFDVGQGEGPGGSTGMDCAGDQELVATVRDFQIAHPDFEYVIQVDPGIVTPMLGGDDKPVYAGPSPTTNGQEAFDQWYRDVPGTNITIDLPMVLTEADDGTYFFDDQAFFPIDDQGWGNEGNDHNFHFTLELHTEFVYQGGEIFSFTGDDDLFTYVNGELAIDLGGVHGAMNGTIDLDAQAALLGITPGHTYRLDFFFAERHTTESHFRIDTTIGCLVDVPVG